MKNFIRIIAVAAILLTGLVGCGESSDRRGVLSDQGKLAMEDLGQFLNGLPGDGKKPPSKMSEFIPLEPMAPVVGDMMKSGDVIYIWGSAIIPNSKSIIGHEKKVETDGGWVLLQDGTVKKMSADEFKSAPKAVKK